MPHHIDRPSLLWLFAHCMLLFLTACERTEYRVHLEPRDGGLAREVTVWKHRTGEEGKPVAPAQSELDLLAAAYGVDPPRSAAEKFTFRGEFQGKLPNDLGGAGWLLKWETPLGASWFYLERVRGDDDLAAQLELRRAAVDQFLDLLLGWLRSELGDREHTQELLRALEGPVRRDLWNVSLLLWQVQLEDEAAENPAVWIPLLQYLAEREYLDPGDLPRWSRAVEELNRPQPSFRLGELLLLALSRRLGSAPGELHPGVARVADWKASEESLDRYLRKSKEFATWAANRPDDPKPLDMLGELAIRGWLGSILVLGSDGLELTLALDAPPVYGNGQWRQETGVLAWQGDLAQRGERLRHPFQMFALWVEPARERQESLFGRVVLEGRSLAAYCRWYQGLAPHEVRRWETFLAELGPNAELIPRLERFRFLEDPADPEAPSLADTPRRLLLEALREPTEE